MNHMLHRYEKVYIASCPVNPLTENVFSSEWLKLMGDDVVHGPTGASNIFQDDDGFLREESRPNLGCKEVRDGGLIDWTTGTGEEGLLQGL
jgi:hypothetical protein